MLQLLKHKQQLNQHNNHLNLISQLKSYNLKRSCRGKATEETVAEAPAAKEPAPSKAASKAKAAAEETVVPTEATTDAESEDVKADKDKPSRPRRPRGRPPKS